MLKSVVGLGVGGMGDVAKFGVGWKVALGVGR